MAFTKEQRADWRRRTKHASDKKYAEAHKDEISAYKARYYQQNKDRILAQSRRNRMLKRYGITEERYSRMLEQQNYSCWICGTAVWELGMDLAVDHDHATGKTRALLCLQCNTALGAFRDSPDILTKAIEYLRKEW